MARLSTRRDARWWLAEDRDEAAKLVTKTAERLADAAKPRHIRDLRHARLYGNEQHAGLLPWQFPLVIEGDTLTMNVIASCVETAAAKIAKNRPAPQFLTNGADWAMRRKAVKLNKFGKGCLHQAQTYKRSQRIFRDACIFGTGIAKYFRRDGRLCMDRVFPWELLVDDQDAQHGEPRMIIHRKYIDRAVLCELFPKREDAIEKTKRAERDAGGSGEQLSDQVEVIEAWHLPSGPKAKDGRHMIVVSGGWLLDEKWTRERFPFAVYRWEDPIAGFWGTGIAQRLTGIQFEINRLLLKIQESFHKLGVARIVLDSGAGIPEAHFNNEIGAILVKNPGSAAPVIVPPQTVHPEIFAQLDRLNAKAYDEVGISQLSAQARKPSGLDSAVALREFNDIETERFSLAGQRWETWHMDGVRLSLDEVREAGGSFRVDVPGRREREEVRWADVQLEDDAFTLQVWPSSLLPQSPAGRLQKAQELIQSGLAPRDRVLEMIDVPDFDAIDAEARAASDVIDWAIDKMLDEGEYIAPEPFDDLELAKTRATAAYNIERRYGAPDHRLQLLRDYIEDAQSLIDEMSAAQAAAAPADPAAMAAPPMAADGLAAMPAMGSA